ncbi:MAG TPA: hypothetical protein G4O08_04080 [Anaerolineae bacterium]|nr:hypothetical protein [Anaerolineae bacterium]
MKETSLKNRLAMSILSIVIGLLMIAAVPFLIQTSLERVLIHLMAHVEAGNPAFASGLQLFDFFYPVWRAIIFVAGIALILTSQQLRKGEEWAYRLAMALYALPSIGGMFMFLPYISFVGGFPLPMVVSWIGLAGFISFIFLRQEQRKVKWTRFATLLFIGMLATHAFVIGIGAQRTLWTRPGHPLYPDFTWWLFNWVGEVNWIAVILLYLSIPFLAVGNRKGWWLATIGAVAILPLNVFTQIFRTKTFDYLIGAVLASVVLIFTQIPSFKKHLLRD